MSKVICLLGASGTGKDTVKKNLPFPHIISYRTRLIRQGEINGVDGYFVNVADYEHAKQQGNILDHTNYNGHHYWTTKEQFSTFLEKDTPVIYVVDGNGVINLKRVFGKDKVIAIWLDVPANELERRMRQRGDTEEQIASRMRYFHDVAVKDKELCDYIVDASGSIFDVSKEVIKQLQRLMDGVQYVL